MIIHVHDIISALLYHAGDDIVLTVLEVFHISPDTVWEILITSVKYLLKIVVILLLWIIASTITKRFMKRLAASWSAKGHGKRADTLAGVLASLSKYAIGFVGICAILGVFQVPVASILAVAGIGSVAIGFGAQSLVKDFITGFFILLEGQFGVGDIVAIGNKTGTVEAIGMRTTRIRSFEGDAHIFPNSQILLVSNMSGSFRHAVVDVNIHFDEHTFSALCDEVRAAAQKLSSLTSEPAIIVLGEPSEGDIRIIAECQVGKNATAEQELRNLIQPFIEK